MRAYTLAEALQYGHGTERPFLCPVHGDSNPSASLNVVKGKWYCYTCHAHGGLTGEAALIEPDAEEMKRWIKRKLEEKRVYSESWLDRWDALGVHPYWEQRCGVEAARHFRLGYDAETNAGTYPLRDTIGQVLGVVRRSFEVGGRKYEYPYGVDVTKLLFNYTPAARRVVVLVEGALDAIACWNVGVDAFAVYGSRFTADQAHLIDRVDPDVVYTAFDRDDAGRTAHREVEDLMAHRLVKELKWPPAWGKDVDEIGKIRLEKVMSVLASDGMSCVGSTSCGSYEKTKISSPSSSSRRRLVIERSST